jgi:hypothetical protein
MTSNFEHYLGIATFAIGWLLALIWFTAIAGNRERRKQTKAQEEISNLLRDLNCKMDALVGLGRDIGEIRSELHRKWHPEFYQQP